MNSFLGHLCPYFDFIPPFSTDVVIHTYAHIQTHNSIKNTTSYIKT